MPSKPGLSGQRGDLLSSGVLAIVGLTVSLLILRTAFLANGFFSFPLDDSWIHLQFAKNLSTFGKFSYYRGEMVTSGSTSPLYVILLALGFLLTNNEFVLSFLLGTAFLIATGLFLFKILRKEMPIAVALPGAVLLLIEPRLQWAALSGMETTLFMFVLVASLYYYTSRNGVVLGVLSGLIVWVRPEGLLFVLILAADLMITRFFRRSQTHPEPSMGWLRPALWITPAGIGLYLLFNLALSGTLFPNTLAAKLAYYASSGHDFFSGVLSFVSTGHMAAIALFGAIGGIAAVRDVIRGRGTGKLVLVLWPVLLCLLYGIMLPLLYQEGRYMMPLLPFVVILAVNGISEAAAFANRHLVQRPQTVLAITAAPLLFIAGQETFATQTMAVNYSAGCRYIHDRQVMTALWVHDHLPADARVATHDVGALGFYSGRQIVDMVGLVSPGMIVNIGSFDGLNRFLIQRHATHLALLRNWFEVANQNPLPSTDERYPEVMEVYDFRPGVTSFVPQGLSREVALAQGYLMKNNPQSAIGYLQHALLAMPANARAHCLLGEALVKVGKKSEAKTEFMQALTLRPDYPEAKVWLASLEQ